MTTDITELVQRDKFEAWWEREYKHLESSKYIDTVPHIKYGFWMAYQAGGAELVEALEKAQETIAFQQGEIKALLSSLESRTVKLPDLRQIVSGDRYVWSDGVYNYSQDVKVALAAAGIKVEAE
ncbi:RelE family toxin-antitoxin system [Klebsiella pneumoniae]|nr:RelE family toxin-antitoxin system [Klebsiella pneumoniae]